MGKENKKSYINDDSEKIVKTCGNCKHFKMVKHGYEIKNILDTAYLISRCKVKGWKVKEYYLANVPSQPIVLTPEEECPYWEEWKPSRFKLWFRR